MYTYIFYTVYTYYNSQINQLRFYYNFFIFCFIFLFLILFRFAFYLLHGRVPVKGFSLNEIKHLIEKRIKSRKKNVQNVQNVKNELMAYVNNFSPVNIKQNI